MSRYKNEKVRVTGKLHDKYNAINAAEMEVFKEGIWKTVWLTLSKEEIDKQIQEAGTW